MSIDLIGPPEVIERIKSAFERAEKAEARVAELESNQTVKAYLRAMARVRELEECLIGVINLATMLDGEHRHIPAIAYAWNVVEGIGQPAPRTDSAPTAGSPLAAVFGKWPGDETDEEIAAALRSETATHDDGWMRRCRDCGVTWNGLGRAPTACHPELGHDWRHLRSGQTGSEVK